MSTLRRRAANLFGLALVLVIGNVQSFAADPAAEVAALHAVDDVWVKAFNGGDADTMAAQYDEHAVLLPPGAPAAHGRAAIRAFFAKMMPEAAKEGEGCSEGNGASGIPRYLWALLQFHSEARIRLFRVADLNRSRRLLARPIQARLLSASRRTASSDASI